MTMPVSCIAPRYNQITRRLKIVTFVPYLYLTSNVDGVIRRNTILLFIVRVLVDGTIDDEKRLGLFRVYFVLFLHVSYCIVIVHLLWATASANV